MDLTVPSGADRRPTVAAVLVAVAAAGGAALLAQVVLLREFLASSQGNELVLGLVLAVWLLLTGLASVLGGMGSPAPQEAARKLGLLLTVAPLVLLGSLWLTSWAGPDALGRVPEFSRLATITFLALAPACCVGGLAFAWSVAALPGQGRAAHLYGAETLGAAAAGLLFHVVVADRLSSAWILFMAGAMCTLAGLCLVLPRRWFAPAVALAVLGVSAAICPRVSAALASARFPGQQVLALEPSRYGLLAVVARGNQRVFFHDGALQFTSEDAWAAEEHVHLPLLLHPNPRGILLVGGGLGGGMVEVLKHKPERLDYAEMDPGLIALARRFADGKTRSAFQDPRVHVETKDARLLMRESPGRYDLILFDLPTPHNALLARLLSVECFEEARRALAPGGLFALVTPGAETQLDAGSRQRHGSLMATLQAVFPAIGVSPGSSTIFWAGEAKVDARPGNLLARIEERDLHLAQIGRTWILDRLLPFHTESFHQSIASLSTAENRDLRPLVFLFGLLEDLQRISPVLARTALIVVRSRWAPWCVGAGVFVLAALVVLVRRGRPAVSMAAACAGAAGMALQLVLLLAYQATQGHLYHALGGLLAANLAGMAAGAFAADRYLERPRVLFRACAGAAASGALVSLAIVCARAWPSAGTAIILVVTILVGASTGAVFPVAVHVASREGSAARLYGWDLAGAAFSAAGVTLLGIPLLGLVPVAALAACLCAAVALANLRSA